MSEKIVDRIFLDKIKGTPQDLYKDKAALMILQIILPQYTAYLVNKLGREDARLALREIAGNIALRIPRVWVPKSSSLNKIILEVYKEMFGGVKLKLKTLEKVKTKPYKGNPRVIIGIDKKCGLCPEIKGEEFQFKGFHFCTPISGFLEVFLNELIKLDFPFKKEYSYVTVETIASKSSGDKYCKHKGTIYYKGEEIP